MTDGADELTEAVKLWTGWGSGSSPSRADGAARLVARFGKVGGQHWLNVVRGLEDDFYLSDANVRAADLAEMASMSSDDFRKRRPGVPEEVVKAFAWCYTFDYR